MAESLAGHLHLSLQLYFFLTIFFYIKVLFRKRKINEPNSYTLSSKVIRVVTGEIHHRGKRTWLSGLIIMCTLKYDGQLL